jgi:hypothetical protein
VAPDSPITKTFTAFLAEIPVDFKGVSLVVYQPDKITISETGGDVSRNIVIPMGMNPTAALPRQNVPKETIARVTVSGEAGKTGRITIRYFLVASQRVCVELFSVNGEKVRDLFNGIQIRGTHSLIASVGEIPKGMYLCRMKIGNNEIVSEVVTLVR